MRINDHDDAGYGFGGRVGVGVGVGSDGVVAAGGEDCGDTSDGGGTGDGFVVVAPLVILAILPEDNRAGIGTRADDGGNCTRVGATGVGAGDGAGDCTGSGVDAGVDAGVGAGSGGGGARRAGFFSSSHALICFRPNCNASSNLFL